MLSKIPTQPCDSYRPAGRIAWGMVSALMLLMVLKFYHYKNSLYDFSSDTSEEMLKFGLFLRKISSKMRLLFLQSTSLGQARCSSRFRLFRFRGFILMKVYWIWSKFL